MTLFITNNHKSNQPALTLKFSNRIEKLAFLENWTMSFTTFCPQIFVSDPRDDSQLFIKSSADQNDPGAYISTAGGWVVNFGSQKACDLFAQFLGFNSTSSAAKKELSILMLDKAFLAQQHNRPVTVLNFRDSLDRINNIIDEEGFKFSRLTSSGKGLFIVFSILSLGILPLAYLLYRIVKNASLKEGHYSSGVKYILPGDERVLTAQERIALAQEHCFTDENKERSSLEEQSGARVVSVSNERYDVLTKQVKKEVVRQEREARAGIIGENRELIEPWRALHSQLNVHARKQYVDRVDVGRQEITARSNIESTYQTLLSQLNALKTEDKKQVVAVEEEQLRARKKAEQLVLEQKHSIITLNRVSWSSDEMQHKNAKLINQLEDIFHGLQHHILVHKNTASSIQTNGLLSVQKQGECKEAFAKAIPQILDLFVAMASRMQSYGDSRIEQIELLRSRIAVGNKKALKTLNKLMYNMVFTPDGQELLPYFNAPGAQRYAQVLQYAIEVISQTLSLWDDEPGQDSDEDIGPGPEPEVVYIDYAHQAQQWREMQARLAEEHRQREFHLMEQLRAREVARVTMALRKKSQVLAHSHARNTAVKECYSGDEVSELRVKELMPESVEQVQQAVDDLGHYWWDNALNLLMQAQEYMKESILNQLMIEVEEKVEQILNPKFHYSYAYA